MKKLIIAFFAFAISLDTCSQEKNKKTNGFGISIPVILNHSYGIYYSLGSRKERDGNSVCYGINVNYSRTIYKNLYGIVGTGYFKQRFVIARPFHFDDPNTNLLYYTESYYYNNIQFLGGIGYSKEIKKRWLAKGSVKYNVYNSLKQRYTVNKKNEIWQDNKKSFLIGSTINIDAGVEKRVNKNISLAVEVTIPVLMRWKDDAIFYEYSYANDTQKIAYNKFTIGTLLSCNYHF